MSRPESTHSLKLSRAGECGWLIRTPLLPLGSRSKLASSITAPAALPMFGQSMRTNAWGRMLHHAGEVSSNPRPHQKQGVRKLSELDKQSLLPRQAQVLATRPAGLQGFQSPAPCGAFFGSNYPLATAEIVLIFRINWPLHWPQFFLMARPES